MVIPPVTEQNSGRYIVIDGVPGAGISTQLELLARRLRSQKYRVQIFTDISSSIDTTEQQSAIYKAKKAGFICIRKRFEISPAIEAFYRTKSKDYNYVNQAASSSDSLKPDFVLILDAPANEMLRRISKRAGENKNSVPSLAELDQLRTGYLWEAKQRGYHVVHAVTSPELIHEEIWQLLVGGPQPVPPVNPPPVFGEPTDIKDVIAEKKKELTTKQVASTNQPTVAPKPTQVSPQSTHKTLSLLAALDIAEQANGSYQEAPMNIETARNSYFVPPALTVALRQRYIATLDKILTNRNMITTKLTEQLMTSSLVPKSKQTAAFKATVLEQTIHITEGLLPLAFHVSVAAKDSSIRANSATTDELKEYTGVLPPNDKLQIFTTDNLPNKQGSMDQDVQLASYWPRNEFDLISTMLYGYTNLNMRDITQAVSKWKYEQKYEVFKQYSGRAFQLANYTWDIQSDCQTLRAILALPNNYKVTRQQLTPRYGFDIPLPIEQAGLEEEYEACFDASAELYSAMQAEGFGDLAPYATLLGHRNRWSINLNAPEIFELQKASGQSIINVARAMQDKLGEVHPVLSDVLIANPVI